MVNVLEIRTVRQTDFMEITKLVEASIGESGVREGICCLFVPHTTAGITINENADPDVKSDMLAAINKLIPFDDHYRHMEGNSAAHIKASFMGSSLNLVIKEGRPVLGTWQGIYFCEFDGPRKRKLVVKLIAG